MWLREKSLFLTISTEVTPNNGKHFIIITWNTEFAGNESQSLQQQGWHIKLACFGGWRGWKGGWSISWIHFSPCESSFFFLHSHNYYLHKNVNNSKKSRIWKQVSSWGVPAFQRHARAHSLAAYSLQLQGYVRHEEYNFLCQNKEQANYVFWC